MVVNLRLVLRRVVVILRNCGVRSALVLTIKMMLAGFATGRSRVSVRPRVLFPPRAPLMALKVLRFTRPVTLMA